MRFSRSGIFWLSRCPSHSACVMSHIRIVTCETWVNRMSDICLSYKCECVPCETAMRPPHFSYQAYLARIMSHISMNLVLHMSHVLHMNGLYFQKCNHVTCNHVNEMHVQSCIANVCIVMYRKRVYNVCQDLRMHSASGAIVLVKFSDTPALQIVSEFQFRA